MTTADEIFRSELQQRGIKYTEAADGRYVVQINELDVSASLDNVRRNYDRDGDRGAIVRFVDQLSATFADELPSWDDVRPYVRYSLEPADYEGGLDDCLFDSVTSDLHKVFVYTSQDGSQITWISDSQVKDWGVARAEIVRRAETNMRDIIAQTECQCDEIDGVKLGMLSSEETPFKASLILSPAFRGLVSPVIGWPVCVVAPCRDFVYVISAKDRQFLGRLGAVVIREYNCSGYPITKDVLEVSDAGIKAIGTFPDTG